MPYTKLIEFSSNFFIFNINSILILTQKAGKNTTTFQKDRLALQTELFSVNNK